MRHQAQALQCGDNYQGNGCHGQSLETTSSQAHEYTSHAAGHMPFPETELLLNSCSKKKKLKSHQGVLPYLCPCCDKPMDLCLG